MKAQDITAVENAARAYFPTLIKAYPSRTQVVKNQINGKDMYLMPVKIGNGAAGMLLNFSMYV